jgi:hypothetical protein
MSIEFSLEDNLDDNSLMAPKQPIRLKILNIKDDKKMEYEDISPAGVLKF